MPMTCRVTGMSSLLKVNHLSSLNWALWCWSLRNTVLLPRIFIALVPTEFERYHYLFYLISNSKLSILFPQEDEDGHLVVLEIIQDLTVKAQEVFLDHFARLGVFSKVLQLAGPPEPAQAVKKEEPVVSYLFDPPCPSLLVTRRLFFNHC